MRGATGALTAVGLALGMALTSAPAGAAVVGNGYSALYSGESVFTSLPVNATGQFSAIFFNDGLQTWLPGVVGLLVCLPDKLTCNAPSPNAAYASGWYSRTVYATVTSAVIPGTNGYFIYSFTVPANAVPGSTATFYGDVGLIGTGETLRPSGYFQSNTVPIYAPPLTITPASASLPVNTTFQFFASSPSTWRVVGGCGAVTTGGLFAATSTNAPSQPCSVVAVSGASSATAPISVFGPATALSCTAGAPTVAADGLSTVVVTASLRDVNGTFLATGTAPNITFHNITPTLDTFPEGPQSPTAGSASVTLTTTIVGGDIQVTATGPGLVGCNAIVRSVVPGLPVKTLASFISNPIAADAASTSVLRVDTLDRSGYRVLVDNSTVIYLSQAPASVAVCHIDGSLAGQVAYGRVEFTIRSTAVPGTCQVDVAANNTSISGTTASMTTRIVGAPARLTVSGINSPQAVSPDGVLMVIVDIVDASGQRVTSSSGQVIVQDDRGSCTGAPGGDIVMVNGTSVPAAQGRATFRFQSTGAYAACALTFTSVGLVQTGTPITFTPASADHLSCAIAPTAILNDGLAMATLTVRLRDSYGNAVTAGGPYSISISRTAGTASTILTATPQLTLNGVATFVLRSTTGLGLDSYGASIAPATQPSLPTPTTVQSCTVSVQATVP